jgi:DNA-binding transcriptional ArsR family regulator
LSLPIGITDPRVVKAYSHPLRIQIHALMDDRVASPSEIARELDIPLATASYHVRRLLELGLIELVERVPRRGSIEHRYTARHHLITSDEEWGALPSVVKRSYISSSLEFGWAHVAAAAVEGGFDRHDIHYSRSHGSVDEKGWNELVAVMRQALTDVDRIIDDSERRARADGASESRKATVILMHFEGPRRDLTSDGLNLQRVRQTGAAAIEAARTTRHDK